MKTIFGREDIWQVYEKNDKARIRKDDNLLALQVLRRGVEDSRRPRPFGLQILKEKQEIRTREVTRTRPPGKMKICGTRSIRYTVQGHALII